MIKGIKENKNFYDKVDPQFYDDMYFEIPREIYLREHWRPIIKETINKYCFGKEVVDFGSGTGIYTYFINRVSKNVIGIDSSKRMVEFARKKYPNIKFIQADACSALFPPSSFDVVFSKGLLEYTDKTMVLSEIKKLLKNEGIAIIMTPNKFSEIRTINRLICKITGRKYKLKEISFNEIKNDFNKLGFIILECRMDDGIIWLPDLLDNLMGIKVYKFIESFFRIFKRNPIGMNMLFVMQKK